MLTRPIYASESRLPPGPAALGLLREFSRVGGGGAVATGAVAAA
jgi:hypothetical protein